MIEWNKLNCSRQDFELPFRKRRLRHGGRELPSEPGQLAGAHRREMLDHVRSDVRVVHAQRERLVAGVANRTGSSAVNPHILYQS